MSAPVDLRHLRGLLSSLSLPDLRHWQAVLGQRGPILPAQWPTEAAEVRQAIAAREAGR